MEDVVVSEQVCIESSDDAVREDPSSYLPLELFMYILADLNPNELIGCITVSKSWSALCLDNSLWKSLCNQFWSDKVYVPKKFKDLLEINAKDAYFGSLQDSKRDYITEEELCSFTWSFRFKASAGQEWLLNDNWWNGREPAKFTFHPSGKVTVKRNGFPNMTDETRTWRFVESTAGLFGPKGSFIQINHFPPYILNRFKNHGFIGQSCWVLLTSFPMPPKGSELDLEDEKLKVTTSVMHLEALAYNLRIQTLQRINLIDILRQNGIIVENDDEDVFEEEEEEENNEPNEFNENNEPNENNDDGDGEERQPMQD